MAELTTKPQLSREDYLQIVRARAETVVAKGFDDITADELAAVTIGGSLEEQSAQRKLVQSKRSRQYVDTTKQDFETVYAQWVAAGSPADWLRRQNGNVIGIIEGME